MVFGRDIRLSRILNNGKMLCIPLDHGISNGPIKGLEDIHGLIYQCASAGLSCVLVNKGIIKTMPRSPDIGLIVHFSGSTSLGPAPNRKMLIGSVEEAIRLGADAVSLHINIGSKEEPEMLQKLGMVSDKCDEWSVPLVAMMYPRGENIKNPHEPDSFKRVVRSCPVPIVIAGGPKANTDKEILEMCNGAMAGGAKGVTFGRNIFQHKNPPAMVRALYKIIIENRNVREALKELD
jgi:fructose-bisphosphate aldolase/2-amino-3,7-dideoxy-D-threo-hept-6-ulosonate synthase